MKLLKFLRQNLDDILVLIGCGLILLGVYQTFPVALPFVAGAMFIVLGWLVARGGGV